MSLRQKTPGDFGGSRSVNTVAASHATRMYSHLSPSTSSTGQNRVVNAHPSNTKAISTSNDISKFTSGISMHHPYKDRGGAFDEKECMQGDPAKLSKFSTPSGGGTSSRSGSKMGYTQRVDNYNNPRMENHMPADPSKYGGGPSGPRGGTRALMNRMGKAGVNKMRSR